MITDRSPRRSMTCLVKVEQEPSGDRAHARSEADHAEGAPDELRLQDNHLAADGADGLELDEAAVGRTLWSRGGRGAGRTRFSPAQPRAFENSPGGRRRSRWPFASMPSAAAGGAGEGSGLVGSVLVLGIEAVAGFRRHEPALLFASGRCDCCRGQWKRRRLRRRLGGHDTGGGLREPAVGRAAVGCSGWWRAVTLAQVRGNDATLHRGRPAAVGRAVGRQLEVERLDETVCERCSLRRVVKCGRLGWSASPGRLRTRPAAPPFSAGSPLRPSRRRVTSRRRSVVSRVEPCWLAGDRTFRFASAGTDRQGRRGRRGPGRRRARRPARRRARAARRGLRAGR